VEEINMPKYIVQHIKEGYHDALYANDKKGAIDKLQKKLSFQDKNHHNYIVKDVFEFGETIIITEDSRSQKSFVA
jgi:hypothetical protein